MQITELAPSRPPCSVAERAAADRLAKQLMRTGLRPRVEALRAPTSPTWAPLLRALLRVWAAALLAASLPRPAAGLAGLALLGSLPGVAGLLRFVPLLGARTQNVVARKKGRDRQATPIVVTAHLDTHGTAGAPMHRAHAMASCVSGLVAFAIGVSGQPGVGGWRPVVGLIAAEGVVTLAWLARGELASPNEAPDDNTSGMIALIRLAELVADPAPLRDVWIVASAAGTSGSYGLTSFLRKHPEARAGWVIEIDGLGSGEVVCSPYTARFPHPGTPPSLIRAVVAAAHESGDPLTVRRMSRPHSDARAALRLRTPALSLTAGLHPPAGTRAVDAANAERAARIVECLARQTTVD